MVAEASSHMSRALYLLAIAVILVNAIRGLATGRAYTIYRSVSRADDPARFWFAVILSGAAAIAAAVGVFLGNW